MAVLVEAYSVLIRANAIRDRFSGGLRAFTEMVPNRTLCTDDELYRVGFMTEEDVGYFVRQLFQAGLTGASDAGIESPDVALASQDGSMLAPCSWVELRQYPVDNGNHFVWGCQLKGGKAEHLAVSERWTYEAYASMLWVEKSEISEVKDDKPFDGAQQVAIAKSDRPHFIGRPFFSKRK
jgi:hypothetical protein